LDISDNIAIATGENSVSIRSYGEQIESVVIYDIAGRKIYNKHDIFDNYFVVSDIVQNSQALVVKIILKNGLVINKKIVF
jgi:hypothetical protein